MADQQNQKQNEQRGADAQRAGGEQRGAASASAASTREYIAKHQIVMKVNGKRTIVQAGKPIQLTDEQARSLGAEAVEPKRTDFGGEAPR
jgi:hypothetical protein